MVSQIVDMSYILHIYKHIFLSAYDNVYYYELASFVDMKNMAHVIIYIY